MTFSITFMSASPDEDDITELIQHESNCTASLKENWSFKTRKCAGKVLSKVR